MVNLADELSHYDASQPLDNRRQLLLAAALPHVAFDGWTDQLFRQAIEDVAGDDQAIRAQLHAACPCGVADLLRFHLRQSRLAYRERLQQEIAQPTWELLKTRQKIFRAVQLHIHGLGQGGMTDRPSLAQELDRQLYQEPDKEEVRRTFHTLMLPGYTAMGRQHLRRLVHLMWRAAGDQSADYNFYTKRGLLAWVYLRTLRCWLDDETPNHAHSWQVLEAAIERIIHMGGRLSRQVNTVQRGLDRLQAKPTASGGKQPLGLWSLAREVMKMEDRLKQATPPPLKPLAAVVGSPQRALGRLKSLREALRGGQTSSHATPFRPVRPRYDA